MTNSGLKFKPLFVFFLAFIGYYFYQLYTVQTKYNRIDKVINEDAWGYYIINPAIFEFNDPNYAFIDSTIKGKANINAYFPPIINTLENGRKVCKYYSGVALLQLPFYAIDRCLFPDDHFKQGLQFHRQMSILLSAIVYLILGFICLMMILHKMGTNNYWIMLICTGILFGSNFLAYTTYDPAYSHVYSFFAIMLMTFLMQRLCLHKQNTLAFLKLGLSIGLVIMIRPVNALAGLALLGFMNQTAWLKIRSNWVLNLLYFLLGIVSLLALQSLIWYWQTGQFLVYPYGQEGLHLLEAKPFEFVFGYNCGWALYTPLMVLLLLISILLLALQKQWSKCLLIGITSYVIIQVLSSWYYLHYGCTVGCRPITEFYGLIGIAVASSIRVYQSKRVYKTIGACIIVCGCYFNSIILFQFYEQIINWCEMDKQRYHMVFLKTHEAYKYASSPFWDFEKLHPSAHKKSIVHPCELSINQNKETDTHQLNLPPMSNKDSAVLYTLFFRQQEMTEQKDAYLRLLLTDKGEYIDLLHLLLLRKINPSPQIQAFTYQFHCSKLAKAPILQLNLESVNHTTQTKLYLDSIWIQNIDKP